MANFLNMIPVPAPLQPESLVYDLNDRLKWGEPALTVIDVRDRDAFNRSHIMGAISMPLEELVGRAQAALETVRDIYLYGASDEETVAAAEQLRAAGFINISVLKGGLPVWKAAGFPIEGNAEVVA